MRIVLRTFARRLASPGFVCRFVWNRQLSPANSCQADDGFRFLSLVFRSMLFPFHFPLRTTVLLIVARVLLYSCFLFFLSFILWQVMALKSCTRYDIGTDVDSPAVSHYLSLARTATNISLIHPRDRVEGTSRSYWFRQAFSSSCLIYRYIFFGVVPKKNCMFCWSAGPLRRPLVGRTAVTVPGS